MKHYSLIALLAALLLLTGCPSPTGDGCLLDEADTMTTTSVPGAQPCWDSESHSGGGSGRTLQLLGGETVTLFDDSQCVAGTTWMMRQNRVVINADGNYTAGRDSERVIATFTANGTQTHFPPSAISFVGVSSFTSAESLRIYRVGTDTPLPRSTYDYSLGMMQRVVGNGSMVDFPKPSYITTLPQPSGVSTVIENRVATGSGVDPSLYFYTLDAARFSLKLFGSTAVNHHTLSCTAAVGSAVCSCSAGSTAQQCAETTCTYSCPLGSNCSDFEAAARTADTSDDLNCTRTRQTKIKLCRDDASPGCTAVVEKSFYESQSCADANCLGEFILSGAPIQDSDFVFLSIEEGAYQRVYNKNYKEWTVSGDNVSFDFPPRDNMTIELRHTTNTDHLIFLGAAPTAGDYEVREPITTTKDTSVDSYATWYNTGIPVIQGNPLSIRASGMVTMDGGPTLETKVVSLSSLVEAGATTSFALSPASHDVFRVQVPDASAGVTSTSGGDQAAYNRACIRDTTGSECPTICDGSDPNIYCWQTKGMGLHFMTNGGHQCWLTNITPPIAKQYGGGGCTHSILQPTAETGLVGEYWIGVPSGQGGNPVTFRLNDTTGNFGDNRGGYKLEVTHYPYPAFNGKRAAGHGSQGWGSVEALVVGPGGESDPNLIDCYRGRTGQQASACSSSHVTWFHVDPVTGKMATEEAPATGTLWLRTYGLMQSGANFTHYYQDNWGSYLVTITTATANTPMHSVSTPGGTVVVSALDKFVLDIQDTAREAMEVVFLQTVIDSGFGNAIRALLTLYIIFYCIMFMFGLIQLSQLDFVIRLVKIALVLTLLQPTSWEFFYEYFFIAFEQGKSDIIGMVAGTVNMSGSYSPFGFLDKTFSYILKPITIFKLLALIFTFPIGLLYLILMVWGMVVFFIAVLKALLAYCMAILALGMLVAVGPIMIPMILFSATRSIFDNWWRRLFRYALEPVILIVGLIILNEFVVITVHHILAYHVCWKCALPITLNGLLPSFMTGGNDITLFCIYWFLPWSFDNEGSGISFTALPFTFATIVMFVIAVDMMEKFADLVPQISGTLTGSGANTGINITGQGSVSDRAAHSLSESAKSVVGMDEESKEREQRRKQVEVMATTGARPGGDIDADHRDSIGGTPDSAETTQNVEDTIESGFNDGGR